MADVSINELPVATEMSDDALSVVYQNYETKSIKGSLIKEYAKESVKNYATLAAQEATAEANAAKDAAQSAQQAAERAVSEAVDASETALDHSNAAAQSAVEAEDAKEAIENLTVNARTLEAGSSATVEKSIIDGVVNLLLGIPRGEVGATGANIASITKTSGNGAPGTIDTYTVTLTDGSTSTFEVYNGKDGQGSGDMSKSVYDPQNKATDVFKYVDDKLANVDFDITADEVTFADGETFQQKYDQGELKGQDGVIGADGVGIASVEQTTTSTEDGGDNVITVTKTDSTSSTFTVKNGTKGSKGDAGSWTQYTGTLPSSGWATDSNGYMAQTITIQGLAASYDVSPDIDVLLSGSDLNSDSELIAAFGLISVAGTVENGLVAKCVGDAPSINIPIIVRVQE